MHQDLGFKVSVVLWASLTVLGFGIQGFCPGSQSLWRDSTQGQLSTDEKSRLPEQGCCGMGVRVGVEADAFRICFGDLGSSKLLHL